MSDVTRSVGFGVRHPWLAEFLKLVEPASLEQVVWLDDMPLEVAAFPIPVKVPGELVSSIRCIVFVTDRVVVCEAPEDVHIWPGGRRMPDEGFIVTAWRETHEETGWILDDESLTRLGFVHFHHLEPQPDDYPLPVPRLPADRVRGRGARGLTP